MVSAKQANIIRQRSIRQKKIQEQQKLSKDCMENKAAIEKALKIDVPFYLDRIDTEIRKRSKSGDRGYIWKQTADLPGIREVRQKLAELLEQQGYVVTLGGESGYRDMSDEIRNVPYSSVTLEIKW